MIITPARANKTLPKDFSSVTLPMSWNEISLVFPSYFRTLTQFPSQMSPRYLRRNHAAQEFLNPPIALLPGELRVV